MQVCFWNIAMISRNLFPSEQLDYGNSLMLLLICSADQSLLLRCQNIDQRRLRSWGRIRWHILVPVGLRNCARLIIDADTAQRHDKPRTKLGIHELCTSTSHRIQTL